MKERRRLEGTDERELEAITREIHAQLRELYAKEPAGTVAPGATRHPAGAGDIARFLGAFLLPPVATVGLLLLLWAVKDGF